MSLVTKNLLKLGFLELGIRAGDQLGVHGSLSSFGSVEGGADTILDSLFETVDQFGTLVMPSYPVGPPVELSQEDNYLGITWKVRVFPLEAVEGRSGMGRIADAFIKRPDVVRSNDRVFSVSAWGKDAALFCQTFKPLVEADGQILLLGVDMDRCSALHIAEERLELPEFIRAKTRIPETILQLYPKDQWSIGYGPAADFLIVQEEAEKLGLVKSVQIGLATVKLCPAKPLVNLYERMLRDDPYRLFRLEKP